MTRICAHGSPYLYDSCVVGQANPVVFTVASGESVILEIAGTTASTLGVIEHAVGNLELGNWQPLVVAGTAAELSATNTMLRLDIPGTYRVNVTWPAVAPACTVISAESYRRGELMPCVLSFPVAPSTACPPDAPVGLITDFSSL